MIRLGIKDYTPVRLPTKGEIIKYFDDGKLSPSRIKDATINEVVPFKEIDTLTLDTWKEGVESYDWLYNPTTDYFLKATLKKVEVDIVFVRTLEGEWFSLGYWGGNLDVDGKMMTRAKEYFTEEELNG